MSVPTSPASTPRRYEPLHCVTVMAKYAPIMYSDPCARFTMFMMPSTSVRPAASRNSMTPSCTPFSSCSKIRAKVIKKRAPTSRPFSGCARALPLHLALLVVRVLVVLEHLLLDVHGHALGRLAVLHRLQQVEVLYRVVIVVELEVTPDRLVVRLAHGGHHALGVLDVALYRAHR